MNKFDIKINKLCGKLITEEISISEFKKLTDKIILAKHRKEKLVKIQNEKR